MPKSASGGNDPTDDDDVALVADFVRRLRRVAVHPLAQQGDFPGDMLQRLMNVEMTVNMNGEVPGTLSTPLPDEVQFESLATRLRPLTLASDRLYWRKGLDALDRLTAHLSERASVAMQTLSTALREEWQVATGRKNRMQAYFLEFDGRRYTDVDLAYAWLYQDLAHGDLTGTGQVGLLQRFQAAVEVFSHIAVVAIKSLNHVKKLNDLHVIELPAVAFTSRVSVAGAEPMRVEVVKAVVLDANLNEVQTGVADDRPQSEVVADLNQQRYSGDIRPASD
jgi:hypothetical protein